MRSLLLVLLALLAVTALSKKRQDTPFIWDLTEGEDKGIGGGFDIVDDTKVIPWIFKYSYDMGRTSTIGTTSYRVPDGISASSVHRFLGFNESRVLTSWSDYQTYSLRTTNINAAINFENVSLTAALATTKGYIKQLTKNGTKNFGFQGGIYLSFGLQFRGMQRPPLDPDFEYDLTHLPSSYDPSSYAKFIRAWGTHYYSRAVYGCQYNITAAFDNQFMEKKGSQWSTSQLDLTLKVNMIEFGLKNQKEVNKSQIDGSFADNVNVQANAKGGDETKFIMGKDFDGWLDSCKTIKVPLALYSDLEPLTTLVTNAQVRANLHKAIVFYGTTGRLPS